MENLTQMFENQPPTSETKPQTYQKTGLGLATIALIVVFLATSAFGGYQIFQRSSLNKDIETAKLELETLKKADFNDNTTITTNLKANFLSQKQRERIFWTNVLFNLESNVPDASKINITSITGSENGTVNISANTTSNSSDPFTDTANLLTVLKTKNFFDGIFIPNISSVVSQTGVGQLNYTLRLNYKKDSTTEKSALKPAELENSNQTIEPSTETPSIADPAVLEELRQRLNQPTTNE